MQLIVINFPAFVLAWKKILFSFQLHQYLSTIECIRFDSAETSVLYKKNYRERKQQQQIEIKYKYRPIVFISTTAWYMYMYLYVVDTKLVCILCNLFLLILRDLADHYTGIYITYIAYSRQFFDSAPMRTEKNNLIYTQIQARPTIPVTMCERQVSYTNAYYHTPRRIHWYRHQENIEYTYASTVPCTYISM